MYPKVIITQDMLDAAHLAVKGSEVNRTKASPFDTLVGHLGEFAVAEYIRGNWQDNSVGNNKGKIDFEKEGIEVKASAFPFRENLNLLVREDYARRRQPNYYVQVIINIKDKKQKTIPVGTEIIICGWATSEEVDDSPLRDMGSKFGGKGGYRCRFIPIKKLKSIDLIKNLL